MDEMARSSSDVTSTGIVDPEEARDDGPEARVGRPEAQAEEPEARVDKPEVQVDEPEVQVDESEGRIDEYERDKVECMVCFDVIPINASMALCSKGHRFCSACCWRCCQISLTEGLVPVCPMDKQEGCGSISKQMAVKILSRWLGQKGMTASRKAELTSFRIKGSIAAGFSSQKLDEVYLDAERAATGSVMCIGRKCGAWYTPAHPHSSEPQRVQCTNPKCGANFCASCRHPYHFRTSCAEALRINARWVRFLQEDLGRFLMAATKVDPDRYQPLLKQNSKHRSDLAEAAKEALRRFDELRQMEKWKQKHCRHCPRCRRIVEKMSGCDAMVCGDDAHGGNMQRGCGHRFNWAQAAPYEADLRAAADDASCTDEGELGRERRMQRDACEEHFLVGGVPVVCDGCGEALVGPRWQCIHCEGVDLCVGCVARAATGKGLALRDGSRHPKLHVFRRVRQGPLVGSSHATPIVDLGSGAAEPSCETPQALPVGTSALGLVESPAALSRGAAGLSSVAARGSRKRPVVLLDNDDEPGEHAAGSSWPGSSGVRGGTSGAAPMVIIEGGGLIDLSSSSEEPCAQEVARTPMAGKRPSTNSMSTAAGGALHERAATVDVVYLD